MFENFIFFKMRSSLIVGHNLPVEYIGGKSIESLNSKVSQQFIGVQLRQVHHKCTLFLFPIQFEWNPVSIVLQLCYLQCCNLHPQRYIVTLFLN